MEENQLPAEEERVESNPRESYTVPWSVTDTWIGVGLLVLVSMGMILLQAFFSNFPWVLIAKGAYLLPVVIILAWRRAPWSALGFRLFDDASFGIGFGLLLAIAIFNLILKLVIVFLGAALFGEHDVDIFTRPDMVFEFFIFAVGLAIAPIIEEIFFQGFLLQGFRPRYGATVAILLTSFIFVLANYNQAPIFLSFAISIALGYIYHRTNSLIPGMILHILATLIPGIIPV